jgi:FMN phosphatase YigB (HAD superfamily)
MRYRAVLFDVGGPLDMELAWEMAVDGAIAAACGMQGIRIEPAQVEEASDAAVAAFAPDVYRAMIDRLCGDPETATRVRRAVAAMTGNLDAFQLRPGIDGLLRRLAGQGFGLAVVSDRPQAERLARAGIADLFGVTGPGTLAETCAALGAAPSACIAVGDRLDADIAPARALGMATIQFRVGRWRRARPRSPAETPDAVVTDVDELEAAIAALQ